MKVKTKEFIISQVIIEALSILIIYLLGIRDITIYVVSMSLYLIPRIYLAKKRGEI